MRTATTRHADTLTAAAFGMMMLATTPAGDAYTFAELERISRNAGFARVELAAPEIGLDRLVIAYGESALKVGPSSKGTPLL